jgi:hypothetical protein
MSLANNPPANAVDRGQARHGAHHGRGRLFRQDRCVLAPNHCLNTGESCGKIVANTYCHAHEYAQALSFQKVDRDDITGAIPSEGPEACKGSACNYVAIECSR